MDEDYWLPRACIQSMSEAEVRLSCTAVEAPAHAVEDSMVA